MLEVFLFINPIGAQCRETEAAVTRLAEKTNAHIDLHFVMLLNFHVIDEMMRQLQLDTKDLTLRNQLFDAATQIALDYKAAQFQGNHKARALLLAEQEMFLDGDFTYDPAFAAACVRGFGFNAARFAADRQVVAAGNCFSEDLALAADMGVDDAPNVVVFDAHADSRTGWRLGATPNYQRLKDICAKLTTLTPPRTPQRLRVL